jgi:cell division septation protein DedD
MLSILSEPAPARQPAFEPPPPAPMAAAAESAERPEETSEYEIVLGRRQIASVLFLATVILVLFSAVSYLAGKSVKPKAPETPVAASPVTPVAAVSPFPPPVAEASIIAAPGRPADAPEAPLFAEPVKGAIYLQMGAVEKGIALIFAEGLRKRGFEAFAAPGPNEKIFRVLIGPLANQEAYRAAKEAVDAIGLSTFARRYEQ